MSLWQFTVTGGLRSTTHAAWDTQDPEASLKRLGYAEAFDATGQFGNLIFLVNPDEAPWYAVVSLLCPGDRDEWIVLPTFPDCLEWYRQYGPAFNSSRAADELGLLRAWFRKLFRALHGHPVHLTCWMCDPQTYTNEPMTRYRPGLEAGYEESE